MVVTVVKSLPPVVIFWFVLGQFVSVLSVYVFVYSKPLLIFCYRTWFLILFLYFMCIFFHKSFVFVRLPQLSCIWVPPTLTDTNDNGIFKSNRKIENSKVLQGMNHNLHPFEALFHALPTKLNWYCSRFSRFRFNWYCKNSKPKVFHIYMADEVTESHSVTAMSMDNFIKKRTCLQN